MYGSAVIVGKQSKKCWVFFCKLLWNFYELVSQLWEKFITCSSCITSLKQKCRLPVLVLKAFSHTLLFGVCHHFLIVTELCGVNWVRCQRCVFPCIVNSPQCMTVTVGCPVKRPGDVSCVPKDYAMWHTFLYVGLLNIYYTVCAKCGSECARDPLCSWLALGVSKQWSSTLDKLQLLDNKFIIRIRCVRREGGARDLKHAGQ